MNKRARPPDRTPETNADQLTPLLTPARTDVCTWHHVDQTLSRHWETPLVKVLRFLTGPILESIDSDEQIDDLPDIDLTDARIEALLQCA